MGFRRRSLPPLPAEDSTVLRCRRWCASCVGKCQHSRVCMPSRYGHMLTWSHIWICLGVLLLKSRGGLRDHRCAGTKGRTPRGSGYGFANAASRSLLQLLPAYPSIPTAPVVVVPSAGAFPQDLYFSMVTYFCSCANVLHPTRRRRFARLFPFFD